MKVFTKLALLALLFVSSCAQTNYNSFVGTWKNQLGSTLEVVSINSDGQISGTYASPSGTSGQTFPLVGWINEATNTQGDHVIVISFTVNWGAYGSITAWNGIFQDNKIKTQWLLTRSNSDFTWDHILTGNDKFTKQ